LWDRRDPDVREPEPSAVDVSATAVGATPPRFLAEPGSLYVVATPLGNLRDVTLRALDILGSADVIAAEDTRVTSVLLRHYGIATRALSLHRHNEAQRAAMLVERLRAGKSVALVSDAGTPAVSDPGARLVRAVQDAGVPVVPIPGPSALATAVSVAGLAAGWFAFLGFLPAAAKARRALLARVAELPCALVLYEAPHRVRATAGELARALGGDRELVVSRELTKKFETVARVRLGDAVAWFAADPNRERGEFVLVVDLPTAPDDGAEAAPGVDVHKLLTALLAELPPARAARAAAAATGLPRDALYARALAIRGGDS
jgi:16S rRNA (cytidine1402-2'-O)-methyltransferase